MHIKRTINLAATVAVVMAVLMAVLCGCRRRYDPIYMLGKDMVTISETMGEKDGYAISKYEVTQALWEAVMGENPSDFKGSLQPVENVSWYDCRKFIRKLNALPEVKAQNIVYRLPTKREWEYACLAGAEAILRDAFGDNIGGYCKMADGTEITRETIGEVAWYEGNSRNKVHPVGKLKPNAFGLYDMNGNVCEWVADRGNSAAILGGSVKAFADKCRATEMFAASTDSRFNLVGFRLARDLTEVERQDALMKIEADIVKGKAALNAALDKLFDSMVQIPEKDYLISKYEVTQELWEALGYKNHSPEKGASLPISNVSSFDIKTFIFRLGIHASRHNLQYRLPTEEEWKNAFHADGGTRITDANVDIVAWTPRNSGGKLHQVALKEPNAFGLYDMLGNASELVVESDDVESDDTKTFAIVGGDSCSLNNRFGLTRFETRITCGYYTGFRLAANREGPWDDEVRTETVNGIQWKYTVSDDAAHIARYCPNAKSRKMVKTVSIPAKLGGCPVTGIGAWAFAGCNGLKAVTIPNSVTSIGESAFAGCDSLASVTIPDSVANIGERAFNLCVGLKSVTWGSGVSDIDDKAFQHCRNLTSIIIPPNVSHIGAGAFYGCLGLKTVKITKGVNIGKEAFPNNVRIEEECSAEDACQTAERKVAEEARKAIIAKLATNMVAIPSLNYAMCKYEVTQALWEAVMGGNPSHFKGVELPVENVSRYDCLKFLERLNALPEVKASGITYRLPTAEEWEYACRAGATGDYCKLADGLEIIENTLGEVAWYIRHSFGPRPVGLKNPNAFGLYDMHGNVLEWTSTADGGGRVCCGGSWLDFAHDCRADLRERNDADDRSHKLGFRLACDNNPENAVSKPEPNGLDAAVPHKMELTSPAEKTQLPAPNAMEEHHKDIGAAEECERRAEEARKAEEARLAAERKAQREARLAEEKQQAELKAAEEASKSATENLVSDMVQIPGKKFWMCKYEVTQALWEAVMGDNPATFKERDNPVENVSWDDCQEFLGKLNAHPSVKKSGLLYRLPTEEEWAFACRAGATGTYCCLGDGTEIAESSLGEVAWFYDNSESKPHPVGQKKPNAFGLCDMHGNVWEWTSTVDGSHRIVCGGCWEETADRCSSSFRRRNLPDYQYVNLGLRLAAD